jgi:predicted DCC family thiol-disulfide oxidoreductase YuxK
MAVGFSTPPDPLASLPPRIVFFDGVCGFCDQTVRWLLEHDIEAQLHFAPLQGETAETVRRRFPDRFPKDLDTVVYLRPDAEGQPDIAVRSAAIFELASDIGGVRWVGSLSALPSWLTDAAYRVFAACRYRIFGKLDACDIPTPGERARLLS